MLLLVFFKAKSSQSTHGSGAPVLEKPIMLMKARDDGGKPGIAPEMAAQPSVAGSSKVEKEGQRPTQPVYQIQNRGMSASASSSAVDRELLQTFSKKCFFVLITISAITVLHSVAHILWDQGRVHIGFQFITQAHYSFTLRG